MITQEEFDVYEAEMEKRTNKIRKEYTSRLKRLLSSGFEKEVELIQKRTEEFKLQYAEGKITKEQMNLKITNYANEVINSNPEVKKVMTEVAKRNTMLAGEMMNTVNQLLPYEQTTAMLETTYKIQKSVYVSSPMYSLVQKNAVKELEEVVRNGQVTSRNHVKFASLNKTKAYNWNSKKATEIIRQGIIEGKSVNKMVNEFLQLQGSNEAAAMRNARTAITSARNAGQLQSLKDAEKIGLNVKKEWISSSDNRTRDSHRSLDGQTVDLDDTFSNGLRYPGDPKGAAGEVYNCRCGMAGVVNGNTINETEGLSESGYVEWLEDTNREAYKDYRNREQAALNQQKQVQAVSDDEVITFSSVKEAMSYFGSTSTIDYGKQYGRGKYKGFEFYHI